MPTANKPPENKPGTLEAGMDTLRGAFQAITETKFGKGFGMLVSLAGSGVALGISMIEEYFGIDILKAENLTKSQKVLPFLAAWLVILTSIPLTIITLAGASALIPPFTMAASAVGIFKNFTEFLRDYFERNNLRGKLIKEKSLIKDILDAKVNLSTNNHPAFQSYVFEQDKIYQALYNYRDALINNQDLSFADKKEIIEQLNTLIEKLYNEEEIKEEDWEILKKITESKPHSPDVTVRFVEEENPSNVKLISPNRFSPSIEETIERLKKYEQGRKLFNDAEKSKELKLPNVLREKIVAYRNIRKNIHVQDLPSGVKQELVKYAEGKKIVKDELHLLYAKVGNRFINSSNEQQLLTLDQNVISKTTKFIRDADDKKIVENYLKQPREVYETLLKARALLKAANKKDELANWNNLIKEFLHSPVHFLDLKDNDESALIASWKKLSSGVSVEDPTAIEEITTALSNLSAAGQEYKAVTQKVEAELKNTWQHPRFEKWQTTLYNYRSQSFEQYVQTKQYTIPTPNINLSSNELPQKASSIAQRSKEWILKKLFGNAAQDRSQQSAKLDDQRQSLQDDFKNRYGATFDTIESSERLRYLEKSVPRLFTNFLFATASFIVSTITTALLPVLGTPGAAVYPVAATVTGAVVTAFTVASLGVSADLVVRQVASELKMGPAKEGVTEGIAPDMENEQIAIARENGILKEVDKNTAKRIAEEKEKEGQAAELLAAKGDFATNDVIEKTNALQNEVIKTQMPVQTALPAEPEEKSKMSSLSKDKAKIDEGATRRRRQISKEIHRLLSSSTNLSNGSKLSGKESGFSSRHGKTPRAG